ncbi:MAG: AMP-binding protein [Deltaproteobacteria bacterium]|uniref:AMP-binding protein n=1 Tax=Candidatus Zymogenus saltonus TaxID=2844893 RepID=A0A9D8KFP4_9DELT|nr:AMP-binding protein [Candidatus Zymogenus saltonus]
MAEKNPYAEKPWLKFYDKHVKEKLKYPDKTYAELFKEAVKSVGNDHPAIYYMGSKITFGELDHYADKFANFLIKMGLKPGDTVGVNLPNIPAYYISIVGIQKAGCILTGVSPLLSAEELEYQLNDSEAKVLVTLDALLPRVEKIVGNTGVKAVVAAGIADYLPAIKSFLGKLLKKIPTGEVKPIEGITVKSYLELLDEMPGDPVLRKVKMDAPSLMQYTGGTTGPPKGAVLTQRNISNHIMQMTVWLDAKVGDDTMLSAFPLFHMAGLFVGMTAMSLGFSQVAIPNPRDLDFIISAIDKYRPNGIVNVPTIFIELLKKPKFRKLDFSSVKWFVSGAAPFPAEYIKEFESVVGKGKLLEVLGMTETSPVTTCLPLYGLKKPGSVGIPYPDTEVKLVDPTTGKIVPVGEAGEFVVKGPQVFTIGYHNKPEETKNALKGGWMYTGDICEMDKDGYFYVVDRLKDMVIVSGFKVFTRNVDDALMEHKDIDMAATIGLPDPNRPGSEIVATAIVLKSGVEGTDKLKEEIIEYMRKKVAKYEVPKRIDFMDELPVSAVGKILKRELRGMMK